MVKKLGSLMLAMAGGMAALLLSAGMLETSSAHALERVGTEPVRWELPAQPSSPDFGDEPTFTAVVVFTDPATVRLMDLYGNVIGEGEHTGEVRCNGDNCSKETQLHIYPDVGFTAHFTDTGFQFKTSLAIDSVERKAIVGGHGTRASGDQQEMFQFVATFQDNRDGTVSVRYESSKPEASYLISKAPGKLLFLIQ